MVQVKEGGKGGDGRRVGVSGVVRKGRGKTREHDQLRLLRFESGTVRGMTLENGDEILEWDNDSRSGDGASGPCGGASSTRHGGPITHFRLVHTALFCSHPLLLIAIAAD